MRSLRPLRPATTATFVLVLLAALLLAAPSAVRPQTASAQSCGYGYGQSYGSVFGQSCYSGQFGNCGLVSTYGCSSYGSTYGCGTYSSYACSNSYGCGNSSYSCTNSYGCSSTLFSQGCGGCTSLFGQSCSGYGSGYGGAGSCVGQVLQAGQSCSNGIITCAATSGGSVPCGGGYGLQSCPPTYTTPQCVAATSSQPIPTTVRPAPQSSNFVTCPSGGFVAVGQTCNPSAGSSYGSSGLPGGAGATTATTPASGFQVSLAAGWNLIGAPQGTMLTGVDGSIFTFQAGDSNYEVDPASSTPLKGGAGYWLNVEQPTQVTLASAGGTSLSIPLPAGQYVMIGNPGTTPATVSGADTVLVYNAGASGYAAATQLQPGQGAWAMSKNGGQATLSNAPAGQALSATPGS